LSDLRIVGFTGTRKGLTPAQRQSLEVVLVGEIGLMTGEVHHGDCVGADEACHDIALEHGWRIVVHPPTVRTMRAFCQAYDEMLPAKGYIDRNRDIVDDTFVLVACPDGPETRRSGTWSTIRWARKNGRPVVIVWPDGRVERREGGGA
jgi:hypothetical protein